jgi:hypothetical protein
MVMTAAPNQQSSPPTPLRDAVLAAENHFDVPAYFKCQKTSADTRSAAENRRTPNE